MNILITYNKKSRPSARVVIKNLSENIEDANIYYYNALTKKKPPVDPDLVINVGNSIVNNNLCKGIVINHPEKVKTAANKRLARIRFRAKKIPSPMLWLSPNKIPPAEYPVIARTSFHMKAKGLWLCKNKAQAIKAQKKGATHYLKYIENTLEFRAHVFSTALEPKSVDDYIIAKLSEKTATESADSDIVKNHDHGYVFIAPRYQKAPHLSRIREIAKLVVKEFGLHYGAVDIMYSNETKKVYVLEINTTPCLTDPNSSTIDVYLEKFRAFAEQLREQQND